MPYQTVGQITASSITSCTSGVCSIGSISIQSENNKMDRCGISIDCTAPSYAYHGLDFALHGIGLAIVIFACTAGFYWYKKAMKNFK
jgi:hypothetical protein